MILIIKHVPLKFLHVAISSFGVSLLLLSAVRVVRVHLLANIDQCECDIKKYTKSALLVILNSTQSLSILSSFVTINF